MSQIKNNVDEHRSSIVSIPKPENEHKEVDYDQLLSSAGEMGRYQGYLCFMSSGFYIFSAMVYFVQVFLTEVSPNHWCWIPELQNLTDIERRNLAIPSDTESEFGYSRCSMYVANWTEVLSSGVVPDDTWVTQTCQNGWEYNLTEIPYPTISSELGWVCDKGSFQATAQSMFFAGSIVGGFVVGWVADRYGRVPGATFAYLIASAAGIASAFTTSFYQFAFCRFIMGMSFDNTMMLIYLLILEYTAPKYRSLMTNLTLAVFYTLGLIILPWIALLCGDWRTLSLATSIPMALAGLAPYVLPESPRWLLAKGRTDEALQKIMLIGKVNRKEIPSKLIEQFKLTNSNDSEQSEKSILELLKRPTLRRIFICSCVEFFCCAVIFDTLVRTIGSLQFDFFVSFTVVSFTEFPSIMLLSFIMDKTGRKWLMIFTLLICGIFSFMVPFVGAGMPSLACAVMARFAVNMGYNTMMQCAAEMLPTPVRATGSSIVHICGYMATIISPFIGYLGTYIGWLPLVIVGCVAVFAAGLCLFLPETANRDMPQTFEDAENLVLSQGMFDFPCMKKQVKENCGHVNDCFDSE